MSYPDPSTYSIEQELQFRMSLFRLVTAPSQQRQSKGDELRQLEDLTAAVLPVRPTRRRRS